MVSPLVDMNLGISRILLFLPQLKVVEKSLAAVQKKSDTASEELHRPLAFIGGGAIAAFRSSRRLLKSAIAERENPIEEAIAEFRRTVADVKAARG
jgi:hypothetical protein